jgi:hypothetical protein
MTQRLKNGWQKLSASARVTLLCAMALPVVCIGVIVAVGQTGDSAEMLPRDYAALFGLNPSDTQSDPDGDGLTNLQESKWGTDPTAADTDCDGWNDSVDSCPVSRMFVMYGDPRFTKGDEVEYVWPRWAQASYKIGGSWSNNGNRTCWHVAASESNPASLNIEADRQTLTNNAVLALTFFDHANSTLYVDLCDTNETVIAEDLFGNLLSGSNANATVLLDVPFEKYPEAAGISIRRESGEATVYESLLYVDQDHDGLDAEQECQLGTSDLVSNGGNAPVVRMPRETAVKTQTKLSVDADETRSALKSSAKTDTSKLARTIYVNGRNGDDACDGLSAVRNGTKGAKKTVKEGLKAAVSGDVLEIQAGVYVEDVNFFGKDVYVKDVGGQVMILSKSP